MEIRRVVKLSESNNYNGNHINYFHVYFNEITGYDFSPKGVEVTEEIIKGLNIPMYKIRPIGFAPLNTNTIYSDNHTTNKTKQYQIMYEEFKNLTDIEIQHILTGVINESKI